MIITVNDFKRLIFKKLNIRGDPTKELILVDQKIIFQRGKTPEIIDSSIITVSKTQKSNFCFTDQNNKIYSTFSKYNRLNLTFFKFESVSTKAENKRVVSSTHLILFSSISQKEEILLQQRLFSSVDCLYGPGHYLRSPKEKMCRYCGRTGHISRNCTRAKDNEVQEVRVVRGVPAARLVPRKEGKLFYQKEYFGEVIANEEAFARDFRARSCNTTTAEEKSSDKQRNTLKIIKAIKGVANKGIIIGINENIILPSQSKQLTSKLCSKNSDVCLFCGQTNHNWQECFIRLAQLKGHSYRECERETCTQPPIRRIEDCMKSTRASRESFCKAFFLPPILIPMMPKGCNDLMIYAFGLVKPLEREDFMWLKEEGKYRHEWSQVSHSMATANPKSSRFNLFPPPPPRLSYLKICSQMSQKLYSSMANPDSFIRYSVCEYNVLKNFFFNIQF
jgi:hypothetical protein